MRELHRYSSELLLGMQGFALRFQSFVFFTNTWVLTACFLYFAQMALN